MIDEKRMYCPEEVAEIAETGGGYLDPETWRTPQNLNHK